MCICNDLTVKTTRKTAGTIPDTVGPPIILKSRIKSLCPQKRQISSLTTNLFSLASSRWSYGRFSRKSESVTTQPFLTCSWDCLVASTETLLQLSPRSDTTSSSSLYTGQHPSRETRALRHSVSTPIHSLHRTCLYRFISSYWVHLPSTSQGPTFLSICGV